MNKQTLIQLLEKGYTHREIGEELGYSKSNVGYWITKYGINDLSKNKEEIIYKDKLYFEKIDTPQKAYVLGFILGDGYIAQDTLEITVARQDKEILDFISKELGGNVRVSNILNKKAKRYPRARLAYHNRILSKHLHKQSGGYTKKDRHIPNVKQHLKPYLLLGFFDAEGCITWGRRKDRNRIWQKVSFTSQYKMLEGIQNILYEEIGIPSKIRPKTGSNCFVLEFSSREAVMTFLEYIYSNQLIVLKRKYRTANHLRLELGEFGESY